MIRINDQISFKWTFNCAPGTNTREKLLGVLETLILASRLQIYDIKVLGDSRIIIEWLKYKGKLQVISLDCWKDRIIHLNRTFRSINYSHIYKDFNKDAYILSKKELHMQEGKINYNQWEEGNEGLSLFLNLYYITFEENIIFFFGSNLPKLLEIDDIFGFTIFG